jgi:catechol 2,3-dioxygenase-like lactoylglutathione lyase family enzyme
MQVTGIGWAGVLTEEFESTLRFFSDVLGLSLAYCDDEKELAHFRFQSGQLLEVYGPSNRQRKEKYKWFHGPVLGFEVDDIQLVKQEMIARRTRFITDLETWEDDIWALFLGPEDNLFEILRPARKPASHFRNVLGICSARFFVQDFKRAIQFFSQSMEMSVVKQGEREIAQYCFPAGHLFEVCGSSVKQLIRIGFAVDDMARARHELEIRGVEFIGSAVVMEDGIARSQFCAPGQFIYELIYDPNHILQ